jgi:uncharacterized membrane protein YgdD (TMEM256/DUF423 family)
MSKKMVLIGGGMIALAIVLGAFGAHALKDLIQDTQKLASFETGVKYQFYMGLAFLVVGFNAEKLSFKLTTISNLWLIGQLCFSVSIYFLSIQEIIPMSLKFLGPITPIGGLLMIIGWILFVVKVYQQKS